MNNDEFSNDYPALATISLILNVIGVIVVVISVFSMGYFLTQLFGYKMLYTQAGFYVVISLIGGLLVSIPYFALAELIKMFARIEFNTRKTISDDSISSPKSVESNQKPSISNNFEITYDDWKKGNPTKTLNDYYAAMRNK